MLNGIWARADRSPRGGRLGFLPPPPLVGIEPMGGTRPPPGRQRGCWEGESERLGERARGGCQKK